MADERTDLHPGDIDHDDVVGDVLIRILAGRVVDDPLSKDKKEPTLWLSADVQAEELFHICELAEASFMQQKPLLEIDRTMLPIHVVADLHGQISHLLRLLRTVGSPQRETFLFLGDYVDRGVQGIELMLLLLCLKIRYPYQVFLLRGNHEDVNTNLNYGFYEECLLRYDRFGTGHGEKVWRAFLDVFNCMPLAALISAKKGRIFCCHGGISPFISRLEDINSVPRPSIVPPFGIGCDLVWSDPGTIPGWSISHRGISFVFGQDVLEQFCKRHSIDLVLRGHQVNEKMYRHGYQMNPGGRLITFFSAPNYMNYKNNGAIVRIDSNLKATFKIFRVKIYDTSEIIPPKKPTSLALFRKRQSGKKKKLQAGGGTATAVGSDTEVVDPLDSKRKPPRSSSSEMRTATGSKISPLRTSGLCPATGRETSSLSSYPGGGQQSREERSYEFDLGGGAERKERKKRSQISKKRG